jgi:hypothetical protein
MLTISRPDVEFERITPFPVETRFIKLPIENYLDALANPNRGDETNNAQRALINAVNNPKYRFICAALSRRLGKTYIANIIAQLVLLVPNSTVLIISPNYNLSGISFELQRKFIKHFGLEVARDNLKDKVLELPNGSMIRLGAATQVDSCVGRSYDLIVFDESALCKGGQEAFNVALRPTLDKPGSKAIFISTPRGKKNWFAVFHQRGFSSEFPEWCSIHADYHENPRMDEKDIAEARKVMSKAEFDQEYMASFVTYEGAIYCLPPECVVEHEIEVEEHWEIIGGLDPGYRDPTAFIILAYDGYKERFYVLAEYQNAEATTEGHAAILNEMIAKYKVETVFIDPAAAQFAGDLAMTYDIATSKAKKDILPGITYCQNVVDTGRLIVPADCLVTLEGLDQYQWDQNETISRERPMHGMASHMMDALRYAIYSFTR